MSIYLIIILCSLLNIFFSHSFNEYTLFLFVIILALISFKLVGFDKNKNIMTKDIILSIIIYCILYYLVIYVIGFFTGFYRNIYNTKFISIIKNTFPVILLILSGETLRYTLNKKIDKNKFLIILSVLAFTLLQNTMILKKIITSSSISGSTTLDYIGLIILPNLTSNIFLTYLSIKVGYKPCIVFRLFMELPAYIIPIYPNFGSYIEAVIKTTLPIIIFIRIYRSIEKNKRKKILILGKDKLSTTLKISTIVITVVLVYFVSGFFKYQAVVIATGSMKPNINIGDVVIVKKTTPKEIEEIKPGEILVFKKDNIIVCHRITKILKSGEYIFFETKGDNNNAPDAYLQSKEQVMGTAILRIPYIGYPSIMLNDILSKK